MVTDGGGGDDGASDDGSWYVSDDGFIDDEELIDEMAGDDALDGDVHQLKASGFFISRGEVQSAAQIAEQQRLEEARRSK